MGGFLGWLHHYSRHKVPLFWRFHAIHHSQRELNLFTDTRNHPLDNVVAQLLIVVPFFVLGAHLRGRVNDVAALSFLLTWYPGFYHANVRTNLSPLRYVLVSPQSHRTHHSIEPEHADKNFGAALSLWDRLFGTQYPSAHEYPATGIADADFPNENRRSPAAVLRCYLSQLLYPLRRGARLRAPTAWQPPSGPPG